MAVIELVEALTVAQQATGEAEAATKRSAKDAEAPAKAEETKTEDTKVEDAKVEDAKPADEAAAEESKDA
jgi:large subunit ribosomal protein L17